MKTPNAIDRFITWTGLSIETQIFIGIVLLICVYTGVTISTIIAARRYERNGRR